MSSLRHASSRGIGYGLLGRTGRDSPTKFRATRAYRAMDTLEAMATRGSVRAYHAEAPSPDDLERILYAMNRAPSAGNLQAYEVAAVRDPTSRRRLAHAANQQMFLADAPVVLVFFAHPARSRRRYGARGEQLYALQDATIAAAYAQLAAHALGYGSAWVGSFRDAEVAAVVDAPPNLQPVCMLAIGRPAEPFAPTPRRRLATLIRDENF